MKSKQILTSQRRLSIFVACVVQKTRHNMRSASSSRFNSRLAQVNLIRRRLCISLVNCADAWQRSTENIKNRKYSARSSAQCSARWWAKLRGAQQKFGQEIRPRDSAKIFDQQKFGQQKLDQTLPPRHAAKKFGQRNSTHNNQPNNSAQKIRQTFSLGLGVLVPGPTVPGPLVLGPWDPGPLGPGPEPANTLQNDLKSAQIIPIIFAYSVPSEVLDWWWRRCACFLHCFRKPYTPSQVGRERLHQPAAEAWFFLCRQPLRLGA